MQVTLRKAATLAKACEEVAAGITVTPTVKVSVHAIPSRVDDYLKKLSKEHRDNLDMLLELLQTRRVIRQLIGQANAAKVSGLMTERAILLDGTTKLLATVTAPKKERERYGEHGSISVKHDANEVSSVSAKLTERLKAGSAADAPDEISIPVFSDAEIEDLKRRANAVRRRRTEVNDDIERENLSRTITLPTETIATLKKHGILDEQAE